MKKNNRSLLVITFFNRKETLIPQCKFLEKYDEDIDIIFVDQSETTWDTPIECAKIKDVHHLPASKYHFYEMWKYICELYKEHSFIYWNNDDDFASPTGIKKAEQFLLANPEYSVAQGQVIQLATLKDINWDYATGEWFKQDMSHESILDRIENTFKNLYVNPHILTRMEIWTTAINLVCETLNSNSSLGPIKFWDKIFTLVAICGGYRKTNLNCLSLIRLHRNISGSLMVDHLVYAHDQRPQHVDPQVPKILESGTSYEEIFNRLEICNPIANNLNSQQNIDLKKAHKTIIEALNIKNMKAFEINEELQKETPLFNHMQEFNNVVNILNE